MKVLIESVVEEAKADDKRTAIIVVTHESQVEKFKLEFLK